jgi:hypothetical protein
MQESIFRLPDLGVPVPVARLREPVPRGTGHAKSVTRPDFSYYLKCLTLSDESESLPLRLFIKSVGTTRAMEIRGGPAR